MRLARRPHHGRRVGAYIYVPPQSAVTIIIVIMSTLPFYLLELNLISAQDLAPVTNKKKFRTYAVAWVNPERKLRTRIDQQGQTNPTWNDKFVFRVDDKFLNSDASAVNIEIYALGWLRDVSVGSVRILITNLIPPAVRPPYNTSSSTRRFVALQIRRPSGRPQGILNMGVTLLDNTMRSMPLNTQVSAFGYNDLMEDIAAAAGGEEMERKQTRQPNKTNNVNATRKHAHAHAHARDEKPTQKPKPKPQLRRSNSDKTGLTSRGLTIKASSMVKGGSMVNGCSMANGGSMVNGGSIVNGFNGSMVNWGPPTINRGGGGSVVNDGGSVVISDVGPSASVVAAAVARGLYPLPGATMRAAQQPGNVGHDLIVCGPCSTLI